MELRDYYRSVGKVNSDEPEPPRSNMYHEEVEKQKNPAAKLMYLGSQERELYEKTTALDTLMNRAKNGLTGALDEIIHKFGQDEPSVFVVKFPPSMIRDGRLIDENGIAHEKFGAKEIENDAQLERLTKNVEKAKSYFPYAELSEITAMDGKRIAIVTGADAKEFNAVIRAEREWEKLSKEAELLALEKKSVMGAMGLNTDVAVQFRGSVEKAETYTVTPSAAKSKEPQLV